MKVIVYDDKDNVVYAQWIDKRVIKLRKLIDKLEIFFMALTMDMEDE